MAIPGAPDPAKAMKEIAQEIQEKFDEAGMAKVEEFTDKIDDIIDKAKDKPKQLMEEAKAKFEEFKNKIDEMLKNPSSLAPGGGAMAACADFYGKSVAAKLGSLNDEAQEMAKNISKVAEDMAGPLKQLGETLEKAMAQLEGSLKALAKLPKLVAKQIEGKDSPDDIAKIDCGPMKKALNCGDVDTPLANIKGLNDILGGAIEAVKKGIAALGEFITGAPDKVKAAFSVPPPLCFLQAMIMSQAPPALKTLEEMIGNLEKIDLKPLVEMLDSTSDTLGNLDAEQVKVPMNKFLESAGDLVDRLDKTVQAAKLSSNPAGAMGKMGGMFK